MRWIWDWLKSWFVNAERWDIYYPWQRMIYVYYDGKKWRYADPLVIYKRVMEVGPELAIDIKVADSPSKDAALCHDKAVAKVLKIFEAHLWDEKTRTGLTEPEVRRMLDHFLTYAERIKKNSNPSATTLRQVSAPHNTISEESPITNNSSGSGSTENESTTDEPMMSPTESK